MKTILLTLFVVSFLATAAFAQNQAIVLNSVPKISTTFESPTFKLFPTQNMWTFIRLDTRNGKMWQIQFDVSGSNRGEVILNSLSPVSSEKEVEGRFILYPTTNIFNFLLLDQIEGNVYQVQWSMEEKNRSVISIN